MAKQRNPKPESELNMEISVDNYFYISKIYDMISLERIDDKTYLDYHMLECGITADDIRHMTQDGLLTLRGTHLKLHKKIYDEYLTPDILRANWVNLEPGTRRRFINRKAIPSIYDIYNFSEGTHMNKEVLAKDTGFKRDMSRWNQDCADLLYLVQDYWQRQKNLRYLEHTVKHGNPYMFSDTDVEVKAPGGFVMGKADNAFIFESFKKHGHDLSGCKIVKTRAGQYVISNGKKNLYRVEYGTRYVQGTCERWMHSLDAYVFFHYPMFYTLSSLGLSDTAKEFLKANEVHIVDSFEMCPVGLDKDECALYWKQEDGIDMYSYKDFNFNGINTRIHLSRMNRGVFLEFPTVSSVHTVMIPLATIMRCLKEDGIEELVKMSSHRRPSTSGIHIMGFASLNMVEADDGTGIWVTIGLDDMHKCAFLPILNEFWTLGATEFAAVMTNTDARLTNFGRVWKRGKARPPRLANRTDGPQTTPQVQGPNPRSRIGTLWSRA